MTNNERILLAALQRLYGAYRADVETTPGMSVLISWQTNGMAIAQAEAAMEAVAPTLLDFNACAQDAVDESYAAARVNASEVLR